MWIFADSKLEEELYAVARHSLCTLQSKAAFVNTKLDFFAAFAISSELKADRFWFDMRYSKVSELAERQLFYSTGNPYSATLFLGMLFRAVSPLFVFNDGFFGIRQLATSIYQTRVVPMLLSAPEGKAAEFKESQDRTWELLQVFFAEFVLEAGRI